MSIPFHSIGVKNGKEKENQKENREDSARASRSGNRDTRNTRSTETTLARTEGGGSVRHLQQQGRGNIEVLTVR